MAKDDKQKQQINELNVKVSELNKENKELKDKANQLPKIQEHVEKLIADLESSLQKTKDAEERASEMTKNYNESEALKQKNKEIENLLKEKAKLEEKVGAIDGNFKLPTPIPSNMVQIIREIVSIPMDKDIMHEAYKIDMKGGGVLLWQFKLKDGKCFESSFEVLKQLS